MDIKEIESRVRETLVDYQDEELNKIVVDLVCVIVEIVESSK